jgi:hypothetical protein
MYRNILQVVNLRDGDDREFIHLWVGRISGGMESMVKRWVRQPTSPERLFTVWQRPVRLADSARTKRFKGIAVSERKEQRSAGFEVLHIRDWLPLCVIYGTNYDFFFNCKVECLGLIGACWTRKIYPVASRKLCFGGSLQVGLVKPGLGFQPFARSSLEWPGYPGHQHAAFPEESTCIAEHSQILLNCWGGRRNKLDRPINVREEETPSQRGANAGVQLVVR